MIRILTTVLTALFLFCIGVDAQYSPDMMRESARSDKLTGGRIVKAQLIPDEDDIRITVNVPSFQMTLWQGGREVKTYPVGVGMREYPIMIGRLKATSVEWNPVWIPPSSDWVERSSKVKPGEIIRPTDPRNPLGKVKIPLGYGFLIHQAKGPGDLGSLVSHGCVRVMQADLYDLSEKIIAARSLDVSGQQIASAKRTKKTLVVPIASALPVEITYDTIVVEGGRLHIYPDVYEHKRNTIANVRAELRSSRINDENMTDSELKRILAKVKGKTQFVVKAADIEAGKTTSRGQFVPVVGSGAAKTKAAPRSRR